MTEAQSKSEAIARVMLDRYVERATADLGESVSAILLVGSLATGSYIPGPGDIDQITILGDSASENAEVRVAQHINRIMVDFGRAINMATVVYRRRDLERPWITEWDLRPETKHLVTIPEELLRIHDHALILLSHGFDPLTLPVPTMDEMMDYAGRWRMWNQACLQRLKPPDPMPVRLMVQTVLSRAIWHYYFATGRTCFNKHEIAGRLNAEVAGYQFQSGLDAATKIRLSAFAGTSDGLIEAVTDCYEEMMAWISAHPAGAVPVSDSLR